MSDQTDLTDMYVSLRPRIAHQLENKYGPGEGPVILEEIDTALGMVFNQLRRRNGESGTLPVNRVNPTILLGLNGLEQAVVLTVANNTIRHRKSWVPVPMVATKEQIGDVVTQYDMNEDDEVRALLVEHARAC